MTSPDEHNIAEVASHFLLKGTYVNHGHFKHGHIHDTYSVNFSRNGDRSRYVLQRINHHVFKNPAALMENIARVTRHIRMKLEREKATDIDRRTLTVIPTCDGRDYLQHEDGSFWRIFKCIERVHTYEIIKDPQQAYEAAKAFGHFQGQLADLPLPRLHETIPLFHHTRARFDTLVNAIETDAFGRAGTAGAEIDFARSREPMVDVLLDMQAAGRLPERITHNDTKLNNVLMDAEKAVGLCVIDLDTVMPGLALYDFGDLVRTGTNTGEEDERDLTRITVDLKIFDALVRGYLDAAGAMLTPPEIEQLAFSGRLITFETGLRFLTDYLSGDEYFKIHREDHNLDRCRTQFKLVEEMERLEAEMIRRVQAHCGTMRPAPSG